MQGQTTHQSAARLKTGLLVILALAIGWVAYSFYELAVGVREFVAQGITAAPSPVPVDVWTALGGIDGEIWVDMLVWLALIPALGKCFLLLLRAPWGRDLTWSDGQWMDTDPMGLPAGAGLPLAASLKESAGGLKAGLIVMVAISGFGLLAAVGAIDLPEDGGVVSPMILVPLFGALAFAAFVAYASANILTRRVQFDDAGLCNANFFRSQRIPWSAVKEFKLGDSSSGPLHDSDGSPKTAQECWLLKDAHGRTMLTLAQNMVPQQSLAALREHFKVRVGSDGFGFPMAAPAVSVALSADAADQRDAAKEEAFARAMREHHEHFKDFDRKFKRTGLMSLTLVLLLFLVPAAVTTYKSLWFTFAAAQTQGVVVDIPADSLPSLVVEYRVGSGKPLRANTDGSDAYSGYKLGDAVRVLYDPAEPEDARLDLFLELWLGPIVLGVLALIVGLIMALIARSFRPRRGA